MSYARKILRGALREEQRQLRMYETHLKNAKKYGTLPHGKGCHGRITTLRRRVRELTAALERLGD